MDTAASRAGGIRRLGIQNFRSIRRAQIDLEDLTILVGPNASGKSNILDAMQFLSECMTSPLAFELESRGGVSTIRYRASELASIALSVHLDLPDPATGGARWLAEYSFTIATPLEHEFRISGERCIIRSTDPYLAASAAAFIRRGQELDADGAELPSEAPDPQGLLLPLLAGGEPWSSVYRALRGIAVYDIAPDEMRQLRDLGRSSRAPRLRPEGQNAADVLLRLEREHPSDYRRLNQFLRAAVPQVVEAAAQIYGPKVGIVVRHASPKNVTFEARDVSDGTLRLLGMLLAIFQPSPPFAIAIEVPETLLHPTTMGVVWDALNTARRRTQVIVTTHSPEVLDYKDLPPTALRLVTWRRGATRVSGVDAQTARTLTRHELTAGDLLRANALLPASD